MSSNPDKEFKEYLNNMIEQANPDNDFKLYLDKMKDLPDSSDIEYNFDSMRVDRIPEDDEGMTEFNQIPSRMPQSLIDKLDGKSKDLPEGHSSMLVARISHRNRDRLKAYAGANKLGYPTYVLEQVLDEFLKSKGY